MSYNIQSSLWFWYILLC